MLGEVMVLKYFGIRVSDLEKSVSFYTDLLGLKKLRQGTMRHGGKWVLLEDSPSHQQLELRYPDNSLHRTCPETGLDHIGFKVQDPASAFRRLIAKGVVKALTPSDKDGVRGIY